MQRLHQLFFWGRRRRGQEGSHKANFVIFGFHFHRLSLTSLSNKKLVLDTSSCDPFYRGCHRSENGQEKQKFFMVRESQRILFQVREY